MTSGIDSFTQVKNPEKGEGAAITLLVKQRLTLDSPYASSFRNVTYSVNDGVLTLRGEVQTFYLKQVLQSLVTDIDGVTTIDNRVDVAQPG